MGCDPGTAAPEVLSVIDGVEVSRCPWATLAEQPRLRRALESFRFGVHRHGLTHADLREGEHWWIVALDLMERARRRRDEEAVK